MKSFFRLLLPLCCFTLNAQAAFNLVYNFQDFQLAPGAVKSVELLPLNNPSTVGTNIITRDKKTRQTDAGGTVTFTNMAAVAGCYKVTFNGSWGATSFTNCFSATDVTNTILYGYNYITNSVYVTTATGYSQDQANARFILATNGAGTGTTLSNVTLRGSTGTTTTTGYVWTAETTGGVGKWAVSSGSGGGSGTTYNFNSDFTIGAVTNIGLKKTNVTLTTPSISNADLTGTTTFLTLISSDITISGPSITTSGGAVTSDDGYFNNLLSRDKGFITFDNPIDLSASTRPQFRFTNTINGSISAVTLTNNILSISSGLQVDGPLNSTNLDAKIAAVGLAGTNNFIKSAQGNGTNLTTISGSATNALRVKVVVNSGIQDYVTANLIWASGRYYDTFTQSYITNSASVWELWEDSTGRLFYNTNQFPWSGFWVKDLGTAYIGLIVQRTNEAAFLDGTAIQPQIDTKLGTATWLLTNSALQTQITALVATNVIQATTNTSFTTNLAALNTSVAANTASNTIFNTNFVKLSGGTMSGRLSITNSTGTNLVDASGISITQGANTVTITNGAVSTSASVTAGSFVQLGASSPLLWSGRAQLISTADGILTIYNAAGSATMAGGIKFGGTTAAFPYFVRSGAGISLIGADGSGSATNSLSVSGSLTATNGFTEQLITKTTNYTATTADSIILVNGTTLTQTIPTAVGATGKHYTIVLIASGTTATVATTSAQTINEATTYSLASQYAYVKVVSDGANWRVVSASPTSSGGGGTNALPITLTYATGTNIAISCTTPAGTVTNAPLTFRLSATNTMFFQNPTGMTDGQELTIEVIQDATGSRLASFDTKWAFGTDITGITLTTTVSKRDFIKAKYNLSADKWYVVGFVRGY